MENVALIFLKSYIYIYVGRQARNCVMLHWRFCDCFSFVEVWGAGWGIMGEWGIWGDYIYIYGFKNIPIGGPL